MPEVRIVFYQDNAVPVLDWIMNLEPKAQTKCLARIQRLQQRGHQLRRPEADYLRDDIYELRVSHRRVNYRILYFFHQRTAAVLAHGLVKERQVPPQDVERAIERKLKFQQNPERYSYQGEV
ncbi:type II toxin-antitoxin system RelE/ParE family toxin [Dehalococcoidia bacterium]|nr:type II toxin-antitoxin system RelE/ParE family toxin [Dehalococcoidia bacterium]